MKGPEVRVMTALEIDLVSRQIADALAIREIANFLGEPEEIGPQVRGQIWDERERYRQMVANKLKGQTWLSSATDLDILAYLIGFYGADVDGFCARMLIRDWEDLNEWGVPAWGARQWTWLQQYTELFFEVGVELRYLT